MGHLAVTDFLAHADADTTLRWHLESNHFPPVHPAFLPVCKRAIKAAQREEWERRFRLPNGKLLSCATIIEGLHLEAFVER